MTDSHPSRSKRGKSRRHVHNSVYDAEASRPQGPHQGQGSPHERGTEGGTGATTTFTEQDYSNTRITDLPDDIPSRASSVPSSANIMNHAQPNKLESGHGGDRTQHEGTFDMQGTTTDQRRIEQPHSGVISTPSMLTTLTPKQEETCQKLQDGDHGFEVDSSIQKSTIMIKRLRSKSESKISGEYRAGHDPGQEQHGNGHKRHLQDHWVKAYLPSSGLCPLSAGDHFQAHIASCQYASKAKAKQTRWSLASKEGIVRGSYI
ncbi:MAG: hypothetical protein BYD32DRAFT_240763 [Podila humilis]|nr:MAG: hypothetical protein BYD32DRAFT_240763 [Podila humilis]